MPSSVRSHSPAGRPQPSASPLPKDHTAATYLTYPVSHVVAGLYRRLTEPSDPPTQPYSQNTSSQSSFKDVSGVYTPPNRTASPFQPPPLTPLSLHGIRSTTSASAQILSRALAEEIRLLVPPRLQLVSDWTLAYSVEQNGSNLGTLYSECDEYRGKHNGFVLVIRDGGGGVSPSTSFTPVHCPPS